MLRTGLLGLGILTGCQPAMPALRPALPDSAFTLGAVGDVPTAIAGQTAAPQAMPSSFSAEPSVPTARTSSEPELTGGSGGSGPSGVRGQVLDSQGQPIVGARIVVGDASVQAGADGRFALDGSRASAVTAMADGFIAQTLGAPYTFRLATRTREPGGPFTLTGVTVPIAPGARVLYVDANGTSAGALADESGNFMLSVEPLGPAEAPAIVAVVSGVDFPLAPRFGVLQAASPLLGAAHVSAGGGVLSVPMFAATGELTPLPSLPDRPNQGATLQLVDGSGLSVPLGNLDATWPTRVPTFLVPGFHVVLSLAAGDAETQTVVERVDAPPGEVWRPTWLDVPGVSPLGSSPTLRWTASAPVAVSATRTGLALPDWEARQAGGSVDLSMLTTGTYDIEVRAVEGETPALSSQPQGARGNRRWAARRVRFQR